MSLLVDVEVGALRPSDQETVQGMNLASLYRISREVRRLTGDGKLWFFVMGESLVMEVVWSHKGKILNFGTSVSSGEILDGTSGAHEAAAASMLRRLRRWRAETTGV